MRILGEIEAALLPPIVIDILKKMKISLPGGEGAVIEYHTDEMQVLKLDFIRLVKESNLVSETQEGLEKSEIMHMIGIALKNSQKSSCLWFKEYALKILEDAEEFDRHSKKTLLTGKGVVYIILVYNGRWVGGDIEDDRIIRDDPDFDLDGNG